MARAAPESTGDEIWFNDAVTLLAERRCGSVEVAEQVLVRGLKGVGRVPVPWSHMREDGSRVAGDTAFFNSPFLTIIRAENRAYDAGLMPPVTPAPPDALDSAVAIKVSRAAALALVPDAAATAVVGNTSTKALIEDEARRMKQCGEIPEGVGAKTRFAKLLAGKAGVTWKYVRNNLTGWGLWPASDIK